VALQADCRLLPAVHMAVGKPLRLAHRPVQGIAAVLVLVERQAYGLQMRLSSSSSSSSSSKSR
jgi:hypothetical protein